jgi:hypothetical protein
MTALRRFRRKPVEVEAMQWDGTDTGATPIIDWILTSGGTAKFYCSHDMGCPGTHEGHTISIRQDHGHMYAYPGWWIIREGNRFHTLRADHFAETYHPVIGASL